MTDFSPQAPPVVHVTNIGCKSTEAKSEKKSLKENFKSRNSKKFMIDFGFYHIFQIFVKLLAKYMKGGSEKSEILCVGQLARAEQKICK